MSGTHTVRRHAQHRAQHWYSLRPWLAGFSPSELGRALVEESGARGRGKRCDCAGATNGLHDDVGPWKLERPLGGCRSVADTSDEILVSGVVSSSSGRGDRSLAAELVAGREWCSTSLDDGVGAALKCWPRWESSGSRYRIRRWPGEETRQLGEATKSPGWGIVVAPIPASLVV